MELTKRIAFSPAYNTKEHGHHPMEMHFVLKGEFGAIVFAVNTGMELSDVPVERRAKNRTYGESISIHSILPLYDNHESYGKCGWIDNYPCYSEASYLDAGALGEKFLREGEEVVWKELEERYSESLGKLKWPELSLGG